MKMRLRGAPLWALLGLAACCAEQRAERSRSWRGKASRGDTTSSNDARADPGEAADAFAPPPQWMRKGILQGRVRGADGQPLAGAVAHVGLLLGEHELFRKRATTDGAGRFVLSQLVPGRVVVQVEHPAHATQRELWWVDPGLNELPDLRLQPGVALPGRVTTPSGQPLAGALVRAFVEGADGSEVARAHSDKNGAFQLAGLTPGCYDVDVSAEHHASARLSRCVTHDTAPEDLRLVLAPRLVLRGRIEPSGGLGVVVVLSEAGRQRAQVAVAADGRFEVAELLPGSYELMAHSTERPWRASAIRTVKLDSANTGVQLELRAADRLAGHVMRQSAHAAGRTEVVAGATVVVRPDQATLLQLTGRTDGFGWFELPPLLPGSYRLEAWADGLLPIARSVSLPHQRPLALQLETGVSLRGRIVDTAGDAVVGALVSALPEHGGAKPGEPLGELGVVPGPVPPIPERDFAGVWGVPATRSLWTATTDARGQFLLSGVPASGLGLLVLHPQFQTISIERIAFVPGTHSERHASKRPREDPREDRCGAPSSRVGGGTIASCTARHSETTTDADVFHLADLVLPAATTIEGRVLDERGFPLIGARLLLSGAGLSQRTTSDGHGAFLLRAAGHAETVLLTAQRFGYQPVRRRLAMLPGSRHEVELTLVPAAGEINGTVFDERGLPLSGAKVRLTGGDMTRQATTHDDGSFALIDVGAGVLQLRVEHAEHVPFERQVRVGQVIVVRLSRLGRLRGRAVDWRTRAPITRFSVQVDSRAPQSFAGSDGVFRLALAPGTHRLQVSAEGFVGAAAQAEVSDPDRVAQDAELRVELRAAGRVLGRVLRASGQPAKGARVSWDDGSATTDETGAFRILRIAEGRHELQAIDADTRATASAVIVVRAGEQFGPVELYLAPSANAQ